MSAATTVVSIANATNSDFYNHHGSTETDLQLGYIGVGTSGSTWSSDMATVHTDARIANVDGLNSNSHYVANSTDLGLKYIHVIHNCDFYRDVDFLIRNIWMYAGYSILTFGTFGHLIFIVLLLLNKCMRSLPLSVFLLTMSAAGLITLYVDLLPTIIWHQSCRSEPIEDQFTEFGCQLFIAAAYFFPQLYAWMEACVAIERMWAVRWALTYQNVSTRRNNAIVSVAIVIVLMAINGVYFKIYSTSNGYCGLEDVELEIIWYYYVDNTVYIILPVAIMLPANAITIHTMYKSPKKSTREVENAKPVAIMMLILNGMFVVTATFKLIGDYFRLDQIEVEAVRLAYNASPLLTYLCYSLIFVVYVAVAARFRKEFSWLLLAGKNKVDASLVATSKIGAPVHGNGERGYAARRAETTSASHATSSTNTTTEAKV